MPINFNTPSERIKSTLSRINTKTILIRNYSEKLEQIKQIPFDFLKHHANLLNNQAYLKSHIFCQHQEQQVILKWYKLASKTFTGY